MVSYGLYPYQNLEINEPWQKTNFKTSKVTSILKTLNALFTDLFPYYLISIKHLRELCITIYKNSLKRIVWFITYNLDFYKNIQLHMLYYIRQRKFTNGSHGGAVFVSFQKAFDTVGHEILIQK